MTWPGAEEIYRFLGSINKEDLVEPFEQALYKACNLYGENKGDGTWIARLKDFAEENNITKDDFQNKALYDIFDQVTDDWY